MKGTLSKVLIFTAGAAVGTLASWRIIKAYYEKLANEEIESVISMFSENQAEPVEGDTEGVEASTPSDKDVVAYGTILRGESYASIPEGKEMDNMTQPYVIPPEEFGEIDEYDTRTLFYHTNDVLTDDEDMPIEDVEGTIGRSSLNHFGEYEDDSVHVRNERLKIDYEILREPSDYIGGANTIPHRAEDE